MKASLCSTSIFCIRKNLIGIRINSNMNHFNNYLQSEFYHNDLKKKPVYSMVIGVMSIKHRNQNSQEFRYT